MSQGQQQKQAAPAATATGKPASQPQSEFDKLMAREVTFTPFGESKPITLNAAQVMHILAGAGNFTPLDGEVVHFKAGDTLFFSPHTRGVWEILETVRKLYVLV